MKIWMSCDMEGVAGIVDWDQCRPGSDVVRAWLRADAGRGQRRHRGRGAGGATEFVVNDSHSRMTNLDPRKIAGRASYLSGRHKPMYMVEGLDDSFDAVFFVGYHGSISGRPSTLSHTYNPEVFAGVRVNGEYVGESGINALPMATTARRSPSSRGLGNPEEAAPFAPDAVNVRTKESMSRAAR